MSVTAPKNNKWTVSGVREILKNPTYAGLILFNERVLTKEMKNGELHTSRHTNKGQIKELVSVKGLHEAIISEEEYRKAETLRKNRDVSPLNKNYALTNPLAGIVYCKICGKRLRKTKSRGRNRIFCYTQNCTNMSCFLSDIENEILLYLEELLKNKKFNCPNINTSHAIELKEDFLKQKKKELDNAFKKKEKIYDLLENGIYDKNTFIERNEKISLLINNLNSEINALSSEIEKIKETQYQENNFLPRVEFALKQYTKTSNVEEKNKLLKTVIDKVYYLKENKEEKFNLWILPKVHHN